MKTSAIVFATTILVIGTTGIARAHFRLIDPPSIHKGENGGKGVPPCGEGPASDVVTDAVGGHPLHVRLQEFVFHPGHYRIALGVNSPNELPPDPDVAQFDGKSISAQIAGFPQIPVLLDGVFAHTTRQKDDFQIDVPLPNLNCQKCTLQVIEFMAEHGPNPGGGFYYHHCAALNIKADSTLPPADQAWSHPSSQGKP